MLVCVCVCVWQASGAEQRLKHLLEELKCQRQNAESSRLQHQQRWKELEKQHQRVRWRMWTEERWGNKKMMLGGEFQIFIRLCFLFNPRKKRIGLWLNLKCVCVQDVTELQRERQCLEKQHQQEVNKLNVELQQARTLHNALQAQADKVKPHTR